MLLSQQRHVPPPDGRDPMVEGAVRPNGSPARGNRRPSGGRAAGRDGGGAGRPALRLSHSDAHPAAGRTPGIRPDPAGAPRPGGVHPGGQHRDRGPAVVSRHGTPDRAFGAQQLHLPQPELLSPQGGGPAHLAAAPRRCDRGRPAVRAGRRRAGRRRTPRGLCRRSGRLDRLASDRTEPPAPLLPGCRGTAG